MSPGPVLPVNDKGRYYHIDCGPGDLATYILTCGDPARVRRLARHMDKIEVRRRNREFLTLTGTYKNIPVSAMATGIGPDNTAIALIEASQCVSPATFIRLGTCGALQQDIAVGDIIITAQALRDEHTTDYYTPPGEPAAAHPAVLAALIQAAQELNAPHHVGLTCTTADFYAGQGRPAPGFPCLDPGKVERLRQAGVLNLEMEMSAYLTLAQVSTYPLRAGGACVAVVNRLTEDRAFHLKSRLLAGQRLLLAVGLRAVEILHGTDSGGAPGAREPLPLPPNPLPQPLKGGWEGSLRGGRGSRRSPGPPLKEPNEPCSSSPGAIPSGTPCAPASPSRAWP